MGRRMAQRLLDAGYDLTVFNRTPERARDLVAAGAAQSGTIAELAGAVNVLVSCVTDTPDVVEVVTGEQGLLAGARQGLIWIDMSTISPEVTRELGRRCAEQGVEALDAPVSGGPPGAEAGTLAIMAGGRKDVFEACLPILQAMGKTITYLGELGAGQVTKACNQMVIAGTLSGIAEALVFGRKAGVDPALIRQALLGGFAASRLLEVHGERMIRHTFEPGFFARLQNKDLHIVLNMARTLKVATPVVALAAENFNALEAAGDGEMDNSAIVRIYERLGGVELTD